jgi:hypothetical protein
MHTIKVGSGVEKKPKAAPKKTKEKRQGKVEGETR